MSREEQELLFAGAIQMHVSYMQTYGPYAVDSLWAILRSGMERGQSLQGCGSEDCEGLRLGHGTCRGIVH